MLSSSEISVKCGSLWHWSSWSSCTISNEKVNIWPLCFRWPKWSFRLYSILMFPNRHVDTKIVLATKAGHIPVVINANQHYFTETGDRCTMNSDEFLAYDCERESTGQLSCTLIENNIPVSHRWDNGQLESASWFSCGIFLSSKRMFEWDNGLNQGEKRQ